MTHYIITSVDLQRFWMPTLQKWTEDQGLTPLYWTSGSETRWAPRVHGGGTEGEALSMALVVVTVERHLHRDAGTVDVEVLWRSTLETTQAALDAVADHMGSAEEGIQDLTGLTLGEFKGRLRRLLRPGRIPPGSLASELPRALLALGLPSNDKVGKRAAVVRVEVGTF